MGFALDRPASEIHPMLIKICGITSHEDARIAADAGAGAIGLMFYEKSVRAVTPEQAAQIVDGLTSFTARVGVFVNPSEELVWQAINAAGLTVLQFHGEEPPDFCLRFGLMTMKAFRIKDASSLDALTHYPTDAWLLDAYSASAHGGTGERFNWDLAVQAKNLGRPVVLAGGLTPDNVAAAITQVQPFGVDVSSGVESAPGKKDPDKVRAFISAARDAFQKIGQT
jgi:phosphoribosylanthranilate isomerase